MKTSTIFLSLFLFSCMFSNAGNGQTMNIRGKVVDKTTLEPLSGVNIVLDQNLKGIGTITNNKGEFRLWNLPHNSSKIIISHNGYESSMIEVTTLQNPMDKTIFIIKLGEETKEIKTNSTERKLAFFRKKAAARK